MNNDIIKNTEAQRLSELILLASEKQAIKKAVFSKPDDKSIVKAVLTLRSIKNQNLLQAEYFHTDNKATHKNLQLDSASDELISMINGFSQINLICTAGECEFKRSKSGKQIIIGEDKLRKALGREKLETVDLYLPVGVTPRFDKVDFLGNHTNNYNQSNNSTNSRHSVKEILKRLNTVKENVKEHCRDRKQRRDKNRNGGYQDEHQKKPGIIIECISLCHTVGNEKRDSEHKALADFVNVIRCKL